MVPHSELPPEVAAQDRSLLVIGVVTMCLGLSTMMVTARICTRKLITAKMGVDDYLAIIAWLLTCGDAIAIALNTRFGLGKHVGAYDPTMIPLYSRTFYVSVVLYTASLLFVKLTFLFQYYRAFSVQKMRGIYVGAIIIVGAWGLSQVLVGIFMCNPVAGFWDKTIKATCIPAAPQQYANAAGNIATDVAVFLLPLPVIGRLNLSTAQRLLLTGIFSLGFFTVAISVVRIQYLETFADFSWQNVDSSCWSIGELTSALTCACLPTLRPLLGRVFPSLSSRISHDRSSYPRHNGRVQDGGNIGSRAMSSGGQSCRSSAPRIPRTPSSGDDREGLCGDEKYFAFSSYELEDHERHDLEEDTVGLRSAGRNMQDDDHNESVSRIHMVGLRPTIRTEIGHDPSRKGGAPRWEIEVHRDVRQTMSAAGAGPP